MVIDRQYKRRIRIMGKLDDLNCVRLNVYDIETGEPITNIQRITIWMDVRRVTTAEVVYMEMNEQGNIREDKHGRPIARIARLDNPEFAVSALEIGHE